MSVLWLLALLALSRLVHRRLLARFGAGTLQHLVRLPGNLVHELAHVVAFLATGYTVRGLNVSLFDPAGRGGVVPGPPWTRWTRPWVANFVSPIAPIFAGVVMLNVLARWGGLPSLPTSVDAVVPLLGTLPVTRWELWAALALGFSVAAEIAPSDIDLAAWWRPALGVTVLTGVIVAGIWQVDPSLPREAAMWLATQGHGPVARALSTAVWSGVAMAPVALLIGAIRR